jgi:chemotaxis protein CheC
MAITDYRDLNSLQLDVLREIGNIGSGRAATSLSEIVGSKIGIDMPVVEILSYDEMMNLIGGPEEIVSAVLVEIERDVEGMVLFIQQKDFLRKIISALVMKEIEEFEELDEMDISAIMEVGNILISSYVNAIAEMTGMEIDISVPSHTVNMAGAILSVPIIRFAEETDRLLMINGDFIVDNETVPSNILLLTDMASLNKILDLLGVNIDG